MVLLQPIVTRHTAQPPVQISQDAVNVRIESKWLWIDVECGLGLDM